MRQSHLRLEPNTRLVRNSHRWKCATKATGAMALQSADDTDFHDNISRTDRRIASIALPVRLLGFLIGDEYALRSPVYQVHASTTTCERRSYLDFGKYSSFRVLHESCCNLNTFRLQTLAALAAEPVATLVGATWVGRMGTMPLAACAAAVSVFSLATKLINLPLTAVTTSLVATASAHSAFLQQSPGNPGTCSWRSTGKGTWRGSLPDKKGNNAPATQEQRAAISSALVLGFTVGLIQGMSQNCMQSSNQQTLSCCGS